MKEVVLEIEKIKKILVVTLTLSVFLISVVGLSYIKKIEEKIDKNKNTLEQLKIIEEDFKIIYEIQKERKASSDFILGFEEDGLKVKRENLTKALKKHNRFTIKNQDLLFSIRGMVDRGELMNLESIYYYSYSLTNTFDMNIEDLRIRIAGGKEELERKLESLKLLNKYIDNILLSQVLKSSMLKDNEEKEEVLKRYERNRIFTNYIYSSFLEKAKLEDIEGLLSLKDMFLSLEYMKDEVTEESYKQQAGLYSRLLVQLKKVERKYFKEMEEGLALYIKN